MIDGMMGMMMKFLQPGKHLFTAMMLKLLTLSPSKYDEFKEMTETADIKRYFEVECIISCRIFFNSNR